MVSNSQPIKAANFGTYTNDEIPIRDAYVLTSGERYYLFGTVGTEAFGTLAKSGFQVYVGTDLETWEGPYTAFANDGTSWATWRYWAPEVYEINGSFYLFAGWSHPSVEQRLCVLKAKNPLGPYEILNADIGPGNDPTLYEKDGRYYLLYNDPDGLRTGEHYKPGMYCNELTDDLSRFRSPRKWVFDATEKELTLGIVSRMPEGWETYTTPTGRLIIMWSGRTSNGNWYASSLAYFDEGLDGKISFSNEFFTPFNMGHNNFFYSIDGSRLMMATHYPDNDHPHPAFLPVNYDAEKDSLTVDTKGFMEKYGAEYLQTFADYTPMSRAEAEAEAK